MHKHPFRTCAALALGAFALDVHAVVVGGQILADTVWDNTLEAYTFSAPVQVAPGVTLTIADGVHVSGGEIDVYGTLDVNGTASSRVRFDGTRIVPGTNTLTRDNPFLIDVAYADFRSGSLYAPTGNAVYGTLRLSDSRLEDLPYLYLWYPTSSVLIERNQFMNTGGISVGSIYDVYVGNNRFENMTDGFAIRNWAGYFNWPMVARYNSFLDTGEPTLELPSGYSSGAMRATENWWGTTDEAVIQAMIFDRSDSFASASYIDYSGFLTGRHPNTPSAVPLPASVWLLGSGLLALTRFRRAVSPRSRLA